jgi:glycosyl transferase family 25
MFAPFDMIRVINLPERRDRRREMRRELAAAGLENDPRVAFFPAIRPVDAGPFSSIGARGVYQSQLAILREAAGRGCSVLILEDDCAFSPAVRDFDFGEGWDIFYGGYDAADPENLAGSDIIGAHMMGFSAKGAQAVCAYLDRLTLTEGHPPIDGAYVWFRRAHPEVPTRFAVPPLAHQRSSRSDIADLRFYDRLPLLRTMAGWARGVMRGWRGGNARNARSAWGGPRA